MEEVKICIVRTSEDHLKKWAEKEKEISEFMKMQMDELTEDEWYESNEL